VRKSCLREDVVGQAVREAGERVRGERGDDEEIPRVEVRIRAVAPTLAG
jgi:hypothetical protein